MGSKLRVSRKEGKFSVNLIIGAFPRVAFIRRFITVIKDFKVVLTTADITSEGSNSDFRFNLASPNNNSLNHHKRTDLVSI
mgnify:CR=1 FL=1